jgi:DNA-binding XRE family transcriptional regulator
MTMRVNGRLIRQLRIKHSYSQEKLAEIVGVNLRTIQRIEANGVASLNTRGTLARALGVKPDDLDVRDARAPTVRSREPAGRLPRWLLLLISIVLIVFGATVLAFSIENGTPIGLLTPPGTGGTLVSLLGFLLLTLLTPLRRWRTYAVLCIVVVSLVASPPSWAIRGLVAISLWMAFELGVLVTSLRLPKHASDQRESMR